MFQYELICYRSSTSSSNFSAGSVITPTASNSTTATTKYDSAAAATSTNDACPTINGITHDNAFSLSATGTFALPGANNV